MFKNLRPLFPYLHKYWKGFVAGTVAGVLTFTVATGTVGVLNLQSQPAMACDGSGC